MDAASLTQALYNAFCTNKPLDMKACSGVLNDYESAYAVQRKFAELKGEPTGGYKISLTSKTTQAPPNRSLANKPSRISLQRPARSNLTT